MNCAVTAALYSLRLGEVGQAERMAHGGDPLSSDYVVESARDLVAVITHLRTDLDENPDAWENATLASFLDAMGAWLASFPQSYVNTGRSVPNPDWRFVADVLCAARVYE